MHLSFIFSRSLFSLFFISFILLLFSSSSSPPPASISQVQGGIFFTSLTDLSDYSSTFSWILMKEVKERDAETFLSPVAASSSSPSKSSVTLTWESTRERERRERHEQTQEEDQGSKSLMNAFGWKRGWFLIREWIFPSSCIFISCTFLLHFQTLREKSLERKLLKIYDKTEPDHERDERKRSWRKKSKKEGATTKMMMKNMVRQKQVYPPSFCSVSCCTLN